MSQRGVYSDVHREVIRARQAAAQTAKKVSKLRKITNDPFAYPFEVQAETRAKMQTLYAELANTQHDCEESVRYLIGQASAVMAENRTDLVSLWVTAQFCIRQPLNDSAYIRLLGPDSPTYRFWNEVKTDDTVKINSRKVP
jgi:hypothetical protein